MKYYIALALILLSLKIKAQQNYSTLTQQALQNMWQAKDEPGYRQALKMYEDAFELYPDSIDGTALYKSSVLASKLKHYDKAFKYLTVLSAMKTDKDGYSGWSYIIGKYSKNEYENLLSDPRWTQLEEKAIVDKAIFYQELQQKENEFFTQNSTADLAEISDPKKLYKQIKNYQPYKGKKDQDYSISFAINDTTKTSFFIHLPKDYNANKKYPVLFFLHGAVRHNALSDYQLAKWNLGGWNRYYTKYADLNQVILVFPKASKQYNWMTPDDGFYMIPQMLKLIKKGINIDDNKVFISGHSNGATGSFSYWMKQPTAFAGFYGFNTYPKVFTGGTFIENSLNRSFINFSTDQDYYYPPKANDSFTKLMHSIQRDYQEYRYEGFPHWFPEFDESEPAYQILFEDLIARERNPFPKQISWELDHEKYGDIDWITHIKLDTISPKATWHKTLNFKIDKWLEYLDPDDDGSDELTLKDVDIQAFTFPRKSGKIIAKYSNNTFEIQSSAIESFTINISPEMVNFKKKVKVYVNGALYFNKKVNYNTEFMLKNFEQNKDREQIWVDYIPIKI